jgi:preprotein translocase subunit SecE
MGEFIGKSGKFIQTIIPSGKKFVSDTISELKKSSWPPKNELMESTLLVIVSVVILGLFVAGVDYLVMNILKMLITK